MLRRNYRKVLMFFFLSIILCANSREIKTASADTRNNQFFLQEASLSSCSNLDVIFIVDQSDSMGRNDAIKNRKFAVEGMIDLLVDLAMNQCPDSHHRIGVISFGAEENTRVDIEMYDINPATATDARLIREELRPRVMADNLGSTYPEPAFVEAEKMFRRNVLDDDEPRKRVIIFITDGLPCAMGYCEGSDYNETTKSLVSLVNGRFHFADDLKNREACLAGVRNNHPDTPLPAEEATACLESYPVSPESYANSTYLFTLLLHNSDEDYVPAAVSQLEAVSEEHAGYLKKNQRQNQIPSSLREILSQLVGVRPSLLNGPSSAVNPYLNKMIVTAYKQSADVQFTLSYTDAAGGIHTIQGGQASDGFLLDPDNGYYQFGANETYTILNPYPGIWNMATSNPSGLDVYYQPIEASIQTDLFTEILQYDRAPFYNESDPFYLEFKLTDSSNNRGAVLQSDKEIFKVDVQAKVTDPDGHSIDYSLLWNPDSQSFRAEQPLQVPLAGAYKLSIVGTTLTHEGEPVVETANENEVFNKATLLFSVDTEFTGLDVTPFEVTSISPTAGETKRSIHGTILDGWPLPVLPFPVRVKITDENGVAFTDPDSIFVNPTDAITAQLSYLPEAEEGEVLQEAITTGTITLLPDPSAPGEFVGQFPNSEFEGAYTLTLAIAPDKMEPGYWPYQHEVKFEFVRADCLFCRVGTYYVILVIILGAIIAAIIHAFLIRTNKISGSLIFIDGSTTIAEFGLYSGVNTRDIKKRELDGYPQLMLKSMRARNVGKKRRTTKQDEEATIHYSGEDQSIRIECVSSGGRKFPVDLYPKTPSIYSEETHVQMVYEPIE